MLQNYKGFITLIILAVFSLWMLKRSPDVIGVKQWAKSEHDVDYFSVAYTKLQMDEFGLPSNKLSADYAVHYRDRSEIKLVKPVTTVYKKNKATWVMQSERGVVTDGGDELFLNGRVIINKVVAKDVQKFTIKTSNLKVEPKIYFAETVEKAQLITAMDVMAGVGMKLFYKSPVRIELLSQVRGKHVYR